MDEGFRVELAAHVEEGFRVEVAAHVEEGFRVDVAAHVEEGFGDIVLQIAEKRAMSMELATEFVQGGEGSDQFSQLLGEIMRAADVHVNVAGGAGGLEAAARLANLQTKVVCVVWCVVCGVWWCHRVRMHLALL